MTDTTNIDNDHLRLLSLFHYIVGGLGVLFACFPLIHVGLGLFMVIAPETLSSTEQVPPAFVGWIFFGVGLLFFLIGQSIAITTIISGRYIDKRKNYRFSFVVACVMCILVPFGTILGIFSIIVLSRDSVKNIYASQ